MDREVNKCVGVNKVNKREFVYDRGSLENFTQENSYTSKTDIPLTYVSNSNIHFSGTDVHKQHLLEEQESYEYLKRRIGERKSPFSIRQRATDTKW